MIGYLFFVLFIVVGFIYRSWFYIFNTLSSGDWPYIFAENIREFRIPTEPPFLWLEPYYQLTSKLGVQVFSLSWEITEKVFWFFPYLIISIISSFLFLKYTSTILRVGKNSLIFIFLGCLIFTTNTYILMLTGGGQMGVAVAYSLTPLVLLQLMKLINLSNFSSSKFKFLITSGLILGAQLMFDPRIFLLSILIGLLYFLFMFKDVNFKIFKKIIFVLIVAIVINFFWILPNFGYFDTEYKSAVDAVNADYLSFATFSNSISLFHPNWPHNIFGKVGFMKPEFIIIPILAYGSLLLLNSKRQLKVQKFKNNLAIKQFSNKAILFFVFLGLLGAFLAKGTNPPFGEIYRRLSDIPGFSAFRDPTKFYTLVVLSYMVLIPFSLNKLSEKVLGIKYKVLSIFSLIFLAYWLILIKPAVFGQLTGTFKPNVVPKEYVAIKDFLNTRSEDLTKTLWVPSIQRFGFNSRSNPAISSMEIFGVSSVSGVLSKFDESKTKQQLMDEEIKYVIIPDDVLGEIFLTDRRHNDRLYIETVKRLKNINWLSELNEDDFGKIKIFEISY